MIRIQGSEIECGRLFDEMDSMLSVDNEYTLQLSLGDIADKVRELIRKISAKVVEVLTKSFSSYARIGVRADAIVKKLNKLDGAPKEGAKSTTELPLSHVRSLVLDGKLSMTAEAATNYLLEFTNVGESELPTAINEFISDFRNNGKLIDLVTDAEPVDKTTIYIKATPLVGNTFISINGDDIGNVSEWLKQCTVLGLDSPEHRTVVEHLGRLKINLHTMSITQKADKTTYKLWTIGDMQTSITNIKRYAASAMEVKKATKKATKAVSKKLKDLSDADRKGYQALQMLPLQSQLILPTKIIRYQIPHVQNILATMEEMIKHYK